MYRITRYPNNYNSTLDYVVQIAGRSNGSGVKITIDEMIGYINCSKLLFPNSHIGLVITKVDNHHLIVDIDGEVALEVQDVETHNLSEDFIKFLMTDNDN